MLYKFSAKNLQSRRSQLAQLINPVPNLIGGLSLTAILLISGCGPKEVNTEKLDIMIKRAESYHAQGQYRASIIESKNAIQTDPKNLRAMLLIADNYMALGDFNGTIELLKKIPEQGIIPNNEYYLLLADAYLKQRKFLSATRTVDKLKSTLSKNEELKKSIILAMSYSGLGRFENSEQWFKKAKDIAPDSPEILEGEIVQAFRMNQTQKAVNLVKNALTAAPQNPDILAWAGNLAKLQDDLEGAAQYYTEALANIPNTDIITAQKFRILTQLIDTFTKLGRTEESYIYSKILAEAFPGQQNIKSKYDEAIDSMRNSQLDDAEKTLKDLLEKSGGSKEIGALLGIIKYQKGDYKEASDLLNKNIDPEIASDNAVQILLSSNWRMNQKEAIVKLLDGEILEKYSGNSKIQAIYGVAALSMKKEAAGIEALGKAMALEPLNPIYPLTIAAHYNEKKEYNKAIVILEKAQADIPNAATISATLVENYQNAGMPDKAKSFSTELLAKYPDSSVIKAVAAKIMMQNGEYPAAEKLLHEVTKADENNAHAYLGLAEAAAKQNDPEAAKKYYRKVIELASFHPSGYKGLLAVYEQQTQRKAGIAELTKLAEDPKNALAANIILSEFHLFLKEYESAVKFAQNAIAAQPLSLKAKRLQSAGFYQIARSQLAKENFDNARKTLLEAKAQGATDLPILDLLARIQINRNELEEAAVTIQEIAEIYPNAPIIFTLEGELYAQQKAYPDAIVAYKRAWKATSSDQVAQRILFLLQEHISHDEARSFAGEWHEVQPKNPSPIYQQAVLHQMDGHNKEAIDYYQATLKMDPNHVDALNNLAWLYFEGNNDQATHLAKQAFDQAPENADIADTYGWILAHTGDKTAAIKILEKAAALNPKNSEIKEHLEKARNL